MNKTALISCANGQDSSYLADLLLSKGYDVVSILRRSSTDNTSRLANAKKYSNFILESGDVTDLPSIYNLMIKYRPDEIYHLAAQSDVAISFKQPSYTLQVGVQGTLNMLDAFYKYCRHSKFLNAASSEMFGNNFDIWTDGKYQDEQTRFSPQSP
jgi:GDPmannose 4,6-dehydratase